MIKNGHTRSSDSFKGYAFSSVASLVEQYLQKFQSPQPMIPFVYELVQVLDCLYSRFIKQEVIEEINTPSSY